MKELKVKEIMEKDIKTIGPDESVKTLADRFIKEKIGGLPVVDDKGDMVGIVTEADLIVQDARIHFPTYIHLLDGFIYLPSSVTRFDREFKKALGATVKDIMTMEVITATEDQTVEDAATLMMDKGISRVPIVNKSGKLLGIVTKRDIVRVISKISS